MCTNTFSMPNRRSLQIILVGCLFGGTSIHRAYAGIRMTDDPVFQTPDPAQYSAGGLQYKFSLFAPPGHAVVLFFPDRSWQGIRFETLLPRAPRKRKLFPQIRPP